MTSYKWQNIRYTNVNMIIRKQYLEIYITNKRLINNIQDKIPK